MGWLDGQANNRMRDLMIMDRINISAIHTIYHNIAQCHTILVSRLNDTEQPVNNVKWTDDNRKDVRPNRQAIPNISFQIL